MQGKTGEELAEEIKENGKTTAKGRYVADTINLSLFTLQQCTFEKGSRQ
jgi:hypothetical protein